MWADTIHGFDCFWSVFVVGWFCGGFGLGLYSVLGWCCVFLCLFAWAGMLYVVVGLGFVLRVCLWFVGLLLDLVMLAWVC